MLDNVDELINLTINQGQNRQSLSGSTTFNRIELPLTGDPLNGNLLKSFFSSYVVNLMINLMQEFMLDMGITLMKLFN